ncbi:MAG: PilZ domain-containing protein [Proteobacteria bacterium]|jgi:hypothetical protein|nr:PilZ domain-containing protein [Pseudomonadota bacterium]MDA0927588.1 PilZ domain-containing protein [Pseudomonadota bacterium]
MDRLESANETRFIEQRSEPRHEKRLAMVGTVRRCETEPSLQGSPIKVETINLSDHGLQFRSDIPLAEGTIIRIAVAVDPRNICSVEGEVRWSGEEDGEPVVGVRLFDNQDSDMDAWMELIKIELF